ncbi:unnamed protein product [Cuscuta campestris]|uniref:Uncharacterized protein n=1 Tax=Cuscuta campestris TaxID=132261 RepID=A0A484MZB1_9ASTE|nr:unnamed protein product [Cuscuta campestris]
MIFLGKRSFKLWIHMSFDDTGFCRSLQIRFGYHISTEITRTNVLESLSLSSGSSPGCHDLFGVEDLLLHVDRDLLHAWEAPGRDRNALHQHIFCIFPLNRSNEAVDSATVLPKPVAATTSPLSDRADLDCGSKETAHNKPTAIPVTVVAEGVPETSRKKKGQGKLPAVTKAVAQTTRFEQPSLTYQNDTLGDAGAQTAPTPTPFAASKAPVSEAKQRGESKGKPSGKATPKDAPKPEKPLFQGVKGPKNTSLQETTIQEENEEREDILVARVDNAEFISAASGLGYGCDKALERGYIGAKKGTELFVMKGIRDTDSGK